MAQRALGVGLAIYSCRFNFLPFLCHAATIYKSITRVPLFAKQKKLVGTSDALKLNRGRRRKQQQPTVGFITKVTCGLSASETGDRHRVLQSLGLCVYLFIIKLPDLAD